MKASRERGRPARTSLAQPRPSPPLGSTGMAPRLSFGLAAAVPAHRVAACSTALKLSGGQRDRMRAGRPHAPRAITPPLRGSRRSRAARRRLMRWGVSGGRLLGKPTCTLWETPVCPRAGRPPCRADHSRKNSRSLMKTNLGMDTNKHKGPEDRWTWQQHKRHQNASAIWCRLVSTMSWDDGCLGARASRPHQAWHSFDHLPHLDQPGMAPRLSFRPTASVPALRDRVAACSIALKLSGGQRDRMRAGRPRSQAIA